MHTMHKIYLLGVCCVAFGLAIPFSSTQAVDVLNLSYRHIHRAPTIQINFKDTEKCLKGQCAAEVCTASVGDIKWACNTGVIIALREKGVDQEVFDDTVNKFRKSCSTEPI